MTARPIVAAGATVAVCGMVVLLGWLLDLTFAKSVVSGWRVMVPATAVSSTFVGLTLFFAAHHRSHQRSAILAARITAAIGLILPVVTVVEYLTGIRTGIEGWFGISFDVSSSVAGRMSPLTSLCFTVLLLSLVAVTTRHGTALLVSRIGAGATLLTSWLAIVAVAFDAGRLADSPRFPGMAVTTIIVVAIGSWASLALSFERDDVAGEYRAPWSRTGAVLFFAFAAPLLLGVLRDAIDTRVPPQVVTSVLVLLLAAAIATIVWHYAARMAAMQRDRERAFLELEERVSERTRELASRNEALRRSEDQLREADRRKDEFLATLAHELRNPLAPIRSAVAVLQSPAVGDEEKLEAQLIIERQVRQMARLIDDLLDVSRITAGKLTLQKSPLQLSELLNLAVATVRPHIDQAQHQLIVSLPREAIFVEGDEARLSQVFANLLHNACKYTDPGGEILLTASLPNETEVEVAVRDNGIGIPTEFLPRLFDKFSQVAPLNHAQGGLGLGLSLVHGIITLHQGRVEARSGGPGRGSEFVVRLPVLHVQDPIPAHPPAAAADVSSRLVSRRVLVVDDNTDSAESLALLLRLEGHIVETAHDGEGALARAERFQPDAILLDLGMPHMDGYEVCARIRSTSWGQSIFLVAQTGWGQAQDRARTYAAGFNAHLTKPVDPAAIQDMLVTLRAG